ncbi:MAG: hypothetical protein AAGI15_02760 [Pseudomonadota bacterium]
MSSNQKYRPASGPGLVLLVLLSACQPTLPPLPDGAPTAEQTLAVEELVARGDAALASGHLDEPRANSAIDLYRRALAIDPNAMAARRGIEAVAERYLAQARRAAEYGAHDRAARQLATARRTDPKHPGLDPTGAYLSLLRESHRYELDMGRSELAARASSLGARLAAFGTRGREPACRTQIRAPRDADGRWIYQQLSRAPGSQRIRSQFELGAPPRVTVLCPRGGSPQPGPGTPAGSTGS